MRSQVAMFVFAIVVGAETSAAHAQLLPRRDLSYSIAKTIAETAIVMNVSEGTVKSTLADARAKLRTRLEVKP